MYSFPPLAAAIGVLSTIITALTTALTPLLGSASPAVAIVLLTMLVRTAMLPLGYAQARGEHVRARLQPRLRDLQRRHSRDRDRLQREIAALYRKEGTSPLAGCLPMLAQAPVFTVLYGLFITSTIAGAPNELLAGTMAGVPLGARLTDVGLTSGLAVFAALGVLLALVAIATRRSMPVTEGVPGASVVRLLPFGTVLVAAVVPLAAGLYLLTTTAWTAAERPILRRRTAPRLD